MTDLELNEMARRLLAGECEEDDDEIEIGRDGGAIEVDLSQGFMRFEVGCGDCGDLSEGVNYRIRLPREGMT